MAIGSVLIKNEGLKKTFNHFFGDTVSEAYISKIFDLKEFDSDDEDLIRKHNESISNDFSTVSNFREIDIGYLIVLTFSTGRTVEINLAEQSCPMSFARFDIRDALVLE